MLRCALLAALLASALLPTHAAAQLEQVLDAAVLRSGFTLSAEEVVYEEARELYEAIGDVRVVQPDGRVLVADWMTFNRRTGVGVAAGNVRIDDSGDRIEAGFVALDLNSTVAVATDATLDSQAPGLAIKGDTIQRTGVDRYHVANANLTTCRCEPDDGKARPWEVDVQEADLQMGGYAVARHLWFRSFGVPIFYMPLVVFPAKTERQSGLLAPRFGYSSRNGTEIELPFFLAARDNVNVTLLPTWLSKRGVKGGLEFEALFGEQGYAEGGVAGLRGDDEVDSDDFETPFSDNRWGAWLRLDQPLAPGTRFGADVAEVSDNQYVVDFDDLPGPVRSQRYLVSSGWLTTGRTGLFAGVSGTKYDDMQNPDNLDRDDRVLNRLADALLSVLPRRIAGLPLRFGIAARDIYFHQDDTRRLLGENLPLPIRGQFFDTGVDGLFNGQERAGNGLFPPGDVYLDDLGAGNSNSEGNGVFDEGEIVADHGNRLDLRPTLSLPVRLGPFETHSEVGYLSTWYAPDRASSEQRSLWTGRVDARMRFARDFRWRDAPLRHVVEPRVAYAVLHAPRQRSNPLFIPDFSRRLERLFDSDLRLLTHNPSDRVPDTSFLLGSIRNQFFSGGGGAGATSLLGELTLGWNYDFETSSSTRAFAEGVFYTPWGWQASTEIGYDPKQSELNDAAATLGWFPESGNEVVVGYRYVRDIPLTFESFPSDPLFDDVRDGEDEINQLSASLELQLLERVDLFASGYLDLNSGGEDSGEVGFRIESSCDCWELITSLSHSSRGDDTRVNVLLRLSGVGRSGRDAPTLFR